MPNEHNFGILNGSGTATKRDEIGCRIQGLILIGVNVTCRLIPFRTQSELIIGSYSNLYRKSEYFNSEVLAVGNGYRTSHGLMQLPPGVERKKNRQSWTSSDFVNGICPKKPVSVSQMKTDIYSVQST